ncbi:hypothetical protein PRUPE_2G007300 [Prunus persica]|uniref:Rad21/Rec8-like protein N-terminal domain-containing protein n=1 Tax=Prunus persica TaxID=3760 RepID=A0A251Q8X0_PRUPE|nr:sister chromatid cohesion 1 protein 3 isoform X1 [Prunus persica]XP_020412034.1 sister chromatid cohesion 1 protein 3 isoform X1 [Prunus persica]ONI20290.1 hypothetical protein PRUPE_2G007300 [Prunus persica]ONI20291.1 hypothetical protein PRUPE_2G007300 [Prunus persica]
MFYSQTFLARKGPLGTVWCAAHLQSRLKKSHYTSTDIPSTVDRIMFPDVPIALRMSGHLLVGVVRIYSKKVDYLYQDCNVVLTSLRKAFASIDLNLPENARQAPVQSITLPDTFDLDALDLDTDLFCEGAHDNHLRSEEDITLTDQIPIGTNPYVAITFDEDIQMYLSHPKEVFGSDATPMDEDILHTPPAEGAPSPGNQTDEQIRFSDDFTLPNFPEVEVPQHVGFEDPVPTNQRESIDLRDRDDGSPEHVQEMEVLRDAVPDFSSEILPPVSPNNRDDVTEPHRSVDPERSEKDILSPIMEETIPSGGPSPLFQPSSGPPASVASLPEGLQNIDTHVSFELQPTPPPEQPRARPRKRKQYFDETLVLSNEFMNKTIQDTSDLLRKRRNIPCSALGVWKLNNSLRKEQIFFQPSLSGLCSDLRNISNKDYISTKSHLFEEALPDSRPTRSPSPTTEAFSEARVAQSPRPFTTEISPERKVARSLPVTEASTEYRGAQSPATQCNPEIDQLRHVEEHDGESILPEFIPSPRFMPSPRRDDLTPAPSPYIRSASVPPLETSAGTQILQTPDLPSSIGFHESVFETPRTIFEEQLRPENTGLSDTPDLRNTAEAEDLYFLEADSSTPAGSQATQGVPGSQGTHAVDSLSVRTRAVAQYLKRQSPITSTSEDLFGDLSLDKILEGKTRKLCARMFYETLVLKSFDLVDVKQEVPYGDISLKLTQTLSKVQI